MVDPDHENLTQRKFYTRNIFNTKISRSMVYTILYISCTIHNTIYIVQYYIYHVLYTILYISCTIHNTIYIMYYIQYYIYHVLYTILYISCTIYNTIYIMYCIQYYIYHVLYTILYISCTIHNTIYIMYYTQYVYTVFPRIVRARSINFTVCIMCGLFGGCELFEEIRYIRYYTQAPNSCDLFLGLYIAVTHYFHALKSCDQVFSPSK